MLSKEFVSKVKELCDEYGYYSTAWAALTLMGRGANNTPVVPVPLTWVKNKRQGVVLERAEKMEAQVKAPVTLMEAEIEIKEEADEVLPVKHIYEDSDTPEYATAGAACLDLMAHSKTGHETEENGGCIEIPPFSTVTVNTGIAVAIPEGHAGLVFARSGIAQRDMIRPANCVGVIDSDYRGQVMLALHNDSNVPQRIRQGSRVAQMMIVKVERLIPQAVDELPETVRGAGGFGSTGEDAP